MIKEHNKLAAAVSEIGAEQEEEKKRRESEKKRLAKEARQRKEKKQQEEDEKKQELYAGLEEDVKKGVEHLKTLTATRMKEVLRYYFDAKGTGSMNKNNLILSIEKAMKDMKDNE